MSGQAFLNGYLSKVAAMPKVLQVATTENAEPVMLSISANSAQLAIMSPDGKKIRGTMRQAVDEQPSYIIPGKDPQAQQQMQRQLQDHWGRTMMRIFYEGGTE